MDSLNLLKKAIKIDKIDIQQEDLFIDDKYIHESISKMIKNYINLNEGDVNLNSTNEDVPKYLHWFEWEKKVLNLFDTVNYNHKIIDLVTNYQIPLYCRSIIIPEGKIFLFGGE